LRQVRNDEDIALVSLTREVRGPVAKGRGDVAPVGVGMLRDVRVGGDDRGRHGGGPQGGSGSRPRVGAPPERTAAVGGGGHAWEARGRRSGPRSAPRAWTAGSAAPMQ